MKPFLKKTLILFVCYPFLLYSQRIEKENITVQLLKEPLFPTETNYRNYELHINSPYKITKEDVYKNAQLEYQKQLEQYNSNIELSKKEHQLKLVEYDEEVKKLKEKFKLESEQFSKQKTIDKLVSVSTPPTLNLPSRPEMNIPPMPKFQEPNLNEALIVDNRILESQISISGFTKEGNYLSIEIDMPRTFFQDNSGKTFANQPTKIKAIQNGIVKLDKTFFADFVEVASRPTNEINLNYQEKIFLQNIIQKINSILNDNFGYQPINTIITLENVKNKGEYDDLEKAYIIVTTNLRKMQSRSGYLPNAEAKENLKKGLTIWKDTLKKINYADKKSVYNEKIGRFIYFNLIKVALLIGNKSEAEIYLNEFQDKMTEMKLDYDEKTELKNLENKIYSL